jgi:tartrate-resistant acid phosphatase type 5
MIMSIWKRLCRQKGLGLFLLCAFGFVLPLSSCDHGERYIPSARETDPGTIRFAVIGDYGSGKAWEADVARLIQGWNVDFITTTGDNNYPRGSGQTIDWNIGQCYHEYIGHYKGSFGPGATVNRFFPIPGHRDWDTDKLQPYLDYFTLPGNGRYYDFVWGPVHFFMLDTDEREPDGATASSVQAQWLQRGLAASKSPWNLVYAHHAPFTSHTVEDIRRMRWPFREWGAQAVLSGYYHIYERLTIDGIPYFVNGAGGTTVSGFGEIDPHSQCRYNRDYGAMLIEANDMKITFRFINRGDRIIDTYVVTKAAVEKGTQEVRPDGHDSISGVSPSRPPAN